MGERFADVSVVKRVPYGMGRHKLRTTNTNAFYPWQFEYTAIRDKILRPIVVPFIHRHHLVFQHNALPNVTRSCPQFLEADSVPVLPWFAYSPDMSPVQHVWDALDRCVRQRVPVPANIQ